MARLALSLLGPLHVTLDDHPITGFATDKVRALLAYLALEARPHRREALAELFWPEQEAAAARTSLRVALTSLRRALVDQTTQTPFLLISRETVQFNPASDVTLDVTTFTDLLRGTAQHAHPPEGLCASCVAQLTDAVALYRGELLQQVLVRDSVAYDEWLTLSRERLHRLALDALAQLAAYHEARGEDAQARQYAWRTLTLEGWDEAAHRCLMRVLSRSGQRAAALAQYERCRKVLKEELGVEPAAETTALYEQIRQGPLAAAVGARPEAVLPNSPGLPHPQAVATLSPELQLPVAPPTNLPAPLTPLIGREREVAAVCDMLCRPEVRLLTLTGTGGVGKTRLGLQVGAVVRHLFADGVFFVPLAPISDPDLVVAAIAQTLDVKDMGGQPLTERLKAVLRDKQLLLVLDNFEQVAEAAPCIAELLTGCPALKVLVTSRVVLRLSGEHEFPLAPLALPDLQRLPPVEALSQTAAVALFVERARAVKPDFALTTENAHAVAEICARLDGLPLALELAAARVKLFSPQALLARLERRLNVLTGGPRDLPSRQQTLRSTIDWSYNLLSASEQALFARLGVFVSGCALEVAEAVCNADGDLLLDVLDGLAALVDKSLLQQIEQASGQPRFTMLETIREYALERLEASGKVEAVRRQHAQFFLRWAEQAEPQPWLQQVWPVHLETEQDNLRAALAWAVAGGAAEVAARLAAALDAFWITRGYLSEGRRWLEAVLGMSSALPASARAKALTAAGDLAGCQGDFGRATALGEASLALWRELENQEQIAWTLFGLGQIAYFQSDHAQATTLLEESLALFRAQDHQRGIAAAIKRLGSAALEQGDYPRAAVLLEESLARSRELGDQAQIADVLHILGMSARLQGDDAQALALEQESLVLSRELGLKPMLPPVLAGLGYIAQRQGDAARARGCFVEALALCREMGRGLPLCLAGLAGVAGMVGQPERAARLFGAAEVLDEAGSRPGVGHQIEIDRNVALARAQLDAATFAAAWAAGRAMPLEQAIAEALEWSKAATNTAEIPQPRQPPPTNLPAPPTRLIGRERELADLGALPRRAEVRLVTLTGAGGSGKTRLALELAADLRDVFPDGVFLVELAPVRQADLVAATIATTLGLKDAGAQPLLERLSAHLHDRHLLLLLDNFEHVLEAGPLLATLLAACPSLKLLITSRAPLHLRGEREVEVAPLALPDLRQPPDLDPRAQAPAVRLFVARVQDVRPDFRLTQENAASVNEICVRLDGLPLALELAARRVKVLSPPSLLDRLRSRLQVLTSGAQDLPARQRTMRAAIDWSYSLLAPDMQALFARLGAFVGGCTIEAAEAICSAGGEPDTAVLDGLQTLVDQSLLQCIEGPAGESRFLMLETIREYALEQLAASGELQALQRRHAEYFLALAQAAEPELRGPQQVRWLDRLEVEQPNLRAALAWSLQAEDNGQRTELGLHLAVALGEFWTRRGYLSEGREWLAYAVSRTEAGGASGPSTVAHCALRAKALKQFAQLAHRQGDLDAARSALQQSLALFQELGDTKEIASALSLLGMQFQMQGEYRRAEALLAESLTLAREIGDTHRISWCLFFLGTVAYAEGNVRQAGEVWEESLTRLRAQGDSWGIALLLTHIGMVAVDQGDYARVGAYLAEGLTLLRELGDRWQTALALEACASLAAQTQRDGHAQMGALRAARLFGAVEMFRETLGAPLLPIYRDHYQRGLAAARALLDQAAFAAAWEEGRAMTLEQAIAEALAALQDEPPSKQMR